MRRIWMAIAPTLEQTRILSTNGPHDTLLKARLSGSPKHPRAMLTLVEALALWQGKKVHAVLVVDGKCRDFGFDSMFYHNIEEYQDTPLYTLDMATIDHHSRRKELFGLGNFRDLHSVLRTEVAR